MSPVDPAPLDRLAAALSPQPAELVAGVRLAGGRNLADVLESPERLRRLTVSTVLNDRRPADPEPLAGVRPELVDLAERVLALPPLQRAVLVLLDLEHLTRAETAGIVDRPVVTVQHLQDRAYAALDTDPYAVAAVLAALSWRPVDPAAVRRAEARLARARTTRTRRRGLLTVAVLVVVAAVIVPGVLRSTTPSTVFVRDYRDWVLSFRLAPPPGYQIESRTVAADVETTSVTRQSGVGGCQIKVGESVAADPDAGRPAGRAVRVQGQPARLVADRPGQARLQWRPDPGLAAEVSCSAMVNAEPFALDLAQLMIFEAEPILLPYRLGPLPSHFHVDQVTVRPAEGDTVVDIWPDEVVPAGVPIAISQHDLADSGSDEMRTTYGVSACQLVDAISVCAGFAAPGAPDAPTEEAQTRQRLRLIMDGLTMAPSGSDHSTWTDARVGLPRD